MGYAVTHPGRVDRLVLLSTTEPGTRYADQICKNLERRGTAADSVERARLFGSPGFEAGRVPVIDSVFRNTFRPWLGEPSLSDQLSFGLHRDAAERGRRAAPLASRNIRQVLSWADLSHIRAPTLILHGERDPIPTEMARELEARIPGARLVVLPRAGHFPALESPDVVLPSILDFLNGVRHGRRLEVMSLTLWREASFR